jgi:chaperonin cofactor prefoldin
MKKKYFEQIRNLLKEAAAEYRKANPINPKQKKNLERQSTRLQAELSILQNELQNKAMGQEFQEDYPGLDYGQLIQGKINKLQSELDRVNSYIQALQSAPVLVAKK